MDIFFSSFVYQPQIATEYSDPFDLKQQIQASEEKAKPDVKPYWSEDDYCVPYDVQNESAKGWSHLEYNSNLITPLMTVS